MSAIHCVAIAPRGRDKTMSETLAANMRTANVNFEAARAPDQTPSAEKLNAALDRATQNLDVLPAAPGLSGTTSDPSGAPSFVLGQGALNAADDAWVNVVALTEELHKTDLSPEKRASLLNDLAQNWQIFQEQSGPILREVGNLISES